MSQSPLSARSRTPRQLLFSLGLLGLAGLAGCGAEPEPVQPPDVILIVIDTLRSQNLGSYGYERDTSPFLDQLAGQGVLFEDTTAQASWTLPSMVSMLTGRYLTEWRDRVPTDGPYLPEVFKNAGYQTVGLSANVLINPGSGFDRGFDYFDGARGELLEGDPADKIRSRDLPQLAEAMWGPLDEALVTDADGKRAPIFLYLQPFDPHAPYNEHEQLADVLPLASMPEVEPEGWQKEMALAMGKPALPTDPQWSAALDHIKRLRSAYDREIRYMDQQLEQAFADLEAKGLLENSIIAVLSDHGECLWERLALKEPEALSKLGPLTLFYQEHGAYLYEETIGTPFFIVGAGLPAGTRVSQAVENIDLFPTLLELCDLAVPDGLHGGSLVSLSKGDVEIWRETVHANALPCVTVREVSSNMKLILPSNPNGSFPDRGPELYDLGADPLERNNLADSMPAEVARLSAKIEAWKKDYPTVTSIGEEIDKEQQDRLDQLGYSGETTGR